MNPPTIGITILIILVFTSLIQLLIQGSEHKKRHKEIQERLNRIEEKIQK